MQADEEFEFIEQTTFQVTPPRLPIQFIHERESGPVKAVLIEANHFQKLMDHIPRSQWMTDWIMNHEHIWGEE